MSCASSRPSWLQWSRRRTSTETLRSRSLPFLMVSLLQWSRRRTSTETSPSPSGRQPYGGFNGAVDERRRRRPVACWRSGVGSGLQWSRRRTSTETEPDAFLQSVLSCFNGAVDERRRRPALLSDVALHALALQWSRRRTSTETVSGFVGSGLISLLQWSRRRTSTETENGVDCPVRRVVASMEPSTNVDGDEKRITTRRIHPPVASMEPSTNVDGDQGHGQAAGRGGATLQWSRRRTSTETRPTGGHV